MRKTICVYRTRETLSFSAPFPGACQWAYVVRFRAA